MGQSQLLTIQNIKRNNRRIYKIWELIIEVRERNGGKENSYVDTNLEVLNEY